MFQLLHNNGRLRLAMQDAYHKHYRQLRSSLDFCKKLFCDFLDSLGVVHMVIDGIDEIPETKRRGALSTLLELKNSCSNLKLLISSRAEADIDQLLRPKAQILTVGQKNLQDISTYVNNTLGQWINTIHITPEESSQVKDQVQQVATKSEGN